VIFSFNQYHTLVSASILTLATVATTPLNNRSSTIASVPTSFAGQWRQYPTLLIPRALQAGSWSISTFPFSLRRLQSRQKRTRFTKDDKTNLLYFSHGARHCFLFYLSVDAMHQRASIDGVIFRVTIFPFSFLQMICISDAGSGSALFLSFPFVYVALHCSGVIPWA
jgi:hypothetical protein